MSIVITGSVAFDYLMTFPGYFRENILPEKLDKISLSFLVDNLTRQRGGCAPNIAYSMALLGERPLVLATAGEDFTDYREWMESCGWRRGFSSGQAAISWEGWFRAAVYCGAATVTRAGRSTRSAMV